MGDLTQLDRSLIPLVVHEELRRYVPVWENYKYKAPCEATCPTGIPVQTRWRLVREGRVDEAVDLALAYTPFPATVCGYLCPNPDHAVVHQTIGLHGPRGCHPTGTGQPQGQDPRTAAPFGQTHRRHRRRPGRPVGGLAVAPQGS